MHVELRAGEPFCRLRLVRQPVPQSPAALPDPASRTHGASAAEGQFAVVDAGSRPSGHGEVPPPTFPPAALSTRAESRCCSTVMEYEVVEGRELALTLLRSIGLISPDNPTGRSTRGWSSPCRAQCLGPREHRLRALPALGSWVEAGVLEQMEAYQHPFLTAPGRAGKRPCRKAPGSS